MLELDHALFYFINQTLDSEILDAVLPYWRSKETWIPFYLLLLCALLYRFRKKGCYIVLAAILTVGATDTISHRLVKQNIQRLRPCQDPIVKQRVDLLVPCGSGYSFTSNHAANHFGLAAFFVYTVGRYYRRTRLWWWLWAASIALAQVYVGVHYPTDIVGGAMIGILIGSIVAYVLNQKIGDIQLIKLPK